MKLSQLFVCCIFIASTACSKKPEEVAISDFIQRVDATTKLELSISILKNDQLGSITGKDSIVYIDSILNAIGQSVKEKYKMDKIRAEGDVRRAEIEVKYERNPKLKALDQKVLDSERAVLESINATLNHIDSGKLENLNSETRRLTKIKAKFESDPDKILALMYRCTYRFRNPLLNGTEQETTGTFILDTLKSKVIKGPLVRPLVKP